MQTGWKACLQFCWRDKFSKFNFAHFSTLANYEDISLNMVKVLNVAEKNDAAKSIANIMSKKSVKMREGFSVFNKIYQFPYKFNNQNVNMVMTSVSGHLLHYEFIGSYRKWNGCKPETLFGAPVVKECPENFLKIKKTLQREVVGAQHLIIWTDGDREGENIGFEIINVCQEVNPRIKVSRAKFSEITDRSITRAFQSLCSPDAQTSQAVDVRMELDLRIGAAFTRFQTLRLKKVFPNHLADRLISYGSCQFPTLGFVVERYKQVQGFVPEPFWKIKVTHQQDDAMIEFNWKRVRLFHQPACFVIFEKCLQNPDAKVVSIKSKNKSKWRPLPLDTVELEKLSSRKLKINAKQTMQIAEKLYSSGYISYPRTETNIFPKDLGLANLVEMQCPSPQWGSFAQGIMSHGPNPRQGTKSDNAHPPIHPTKYTGNLSGNEQKIYEFIVRHFLACVSKDALGHETTVDIEISEEEFSANGLAIIERNYLDVYPYDKWNAKIIPVFSMHQIFSPTSIEMVDGETSPPQLLTEADLIALMEKHGIGTDATHADHIETIKSRMYVGVRDDGRFVPGELGMGLVEGYDDMGFEMSKPYLRAELEADLQRICQGVKDPSEVLTQQVEKYRQVFSQSVTKAIKLDEAVSKYLSAPLTAISAEELEPNELNIICQCANCGMEMALKERKNGKGFYIGCMAYPNCKSSIWLPSYVENVCLDDSICQKCQPGSVRQLKFKFRRGSMRPYYPDEYTGCIGGCDHIFLESLGIHSPQRSSIYGSLADTTNSLSMPERVPRRQSQFRDSGYTSCDNQGNISRHNSNQTFPIFQNARTSSLTQNRDNNQLENRPKASQSKKRESSRKTASALLSVTGSSMSRKK